MRRSSIALASAAAVATVGLIAAPLVQATEVTPRMSSSALQKCGSTLLCYIVSLVNTENRIKNFRNDFDILPMLSFPTKSAPIRVLAAPWRTGRRRIRHRLFLASGVRLGCH